MMQPVVTSGILARDLRHALDPVTFAEDLNLGYELDPWQARALRWRGKRLILNIHRQAGKSTIAGILGLWTALYDPGLILLISPSLRQSGELFRKVTDLLDYLEVEPGLVEDNKHSIELENKARVISLPSSEGTIRGYSGARLIIEDESSRVPDELYFAVRPMLAVSKGRLILMSTPFGKRGHFYEEWTRGQEWEKIMVPVSECNRISPEFLEEEERSLGPWYYKQEYLCEFVDTTDQLIPTETIMKQSGNIPTLFEGEDFWS